MKNVIIGATGLTGTLLANKLVLIQKNNSVTAFVRRRPDVTDKKISFKIINFDNIENLRFKADVAFSCLGTTIKNAGSRDNFRKVDFTYNLEFAKVCKANGVKKFILLSALGANPESYVFYNRIKGELEEAVKQLGFEYLTILRPSLLEGCRIEWRTGEFAAQKIMKLLNPLLIGGLKKYRSVSINKLTDIMISDLNRKEPGIRIIESDEISDFLKD